MHLGFHHCLVKNKFALSDTYYTGTTLLHLNMAARTDYSGREKFSEDEKLECFLRRYFRQLLIKIELWNFLEDNFSMITDLKAAAVTFLKVGEICSEKI